MQFLRKIAWPVAVLYGIAVYLRNWCYDVGVFKAKSYRTPTICIGNLSVGGTGKTPMVEYLIAVLQKNNRLAVLSRGYKRNSKGFILADTDTKFEALGDEPFQMHSKFKDVALAVDSDRQNGMTQLEALVQPDIVLLDDAFQHRKVIPGFNILLTTYDKLFVDDFYLPTGTLRDSKNQVKRAHVVIVTKCPKDLDAKRKDKIKEKLGLEVPVLFAYFDYAQRAIGPKGNMPLAELQKKEITLVTGIAKPGPLVSYLSANSLDFDHLSFPDHHNFTMKDLKKIGKCPLVLTTEKDFSRLNGKVDNLYYIGVKHVLMDAGKEQLEHLLHHYLTPPSQSLN